MEPRLLGRCDGNGRPKTLGLGGLPAVSDDREPSGRRSRSRGGSASGAVCLEQTCHLTCETLSDIRQLVLLTLCTCVLEVYTRAKVARRWSLAAQAIQMLRYDEIVSGILDLYPSIGLYILVFRTPRIAGSGHACELGIGCEPFVQHGTACYADLCITRDLGPTTRSWGMVACGPCSSHTQNLKPTISCRWVAFTTKFE